MGAVAPMEHGLTVSQEAPLCFLEVVFGTRNGQLQNCPRLGTKTIGCLHMTGVFAVMVKSKAMLA